MSLTPFIAEVIETGPLTYKENPKSKEGKTLPVGSIRVRPLVTSTKTNLELIYARPMTLSIGIPPLNGEHVLIFPGPSLDESEGGNVNASHYYFPFALNTTDDPVINQMPDTNFRVPPKKQGKSSSGTQLATTTGAIIAGTLGSILSGLWDSLIPFNPPSLALDSVQLNPGISDSLQEPTITRFAADRPNLPVIPGKTFPFPSRPIRPLQWYEGDFILQSKGGSSLRLGIGTQIDSQYGVQPEYHATPPKGSPMFSLVCDEPDSPKPRPLAEIPRAISNLVNYPPFKNTSQKFRTESLQRVKTGIYGGIQLQLSKIIPARSCYTRGGVLSGIQGLFDSISDLPKFKGAQIALDTDRVVLNAKRDSGFFLARKKIVIEASKIYLITNKHKIDVDELVDEVQNLAQELVKLTSGVYPFATAVGPTGPSPLGLIAFVKRLRALMGLNHSCLTPPSPPTAPPPPADFGVNSVTPPRGDRRIIPMGGSDDSNAALVSDSGNLPTGGGTGAGASNPFSNSTSGGGGGSGGSASQSDSNSPRPSSSSISGSSTAVIDSGPYGAGTNTGPGTGNRYTEVSSQPSISPESLLNQLNLCEYFIEMFDPTGRGWADSFLDIKVNGVSIIKLSNLGRNSNQTIKVKKGDLLEVIYEEGSTPSVGSYFVSLDSKILFSSNLTQGSVFKHTCKSLDDVSKPPQVSFSLHPSELYDPQNYSLNSNPGSPVYFYDFSTQALSLNSQVQTPEQYKLALITSDSDYKGWYVVDSTPLDFSPSVDSILTSDTLADVDCLKDSILKSRCTPSMQFFDSKIKKLPYTIFLKK